MAIGSAWQPLTKHVIDSLPDATGVFEIGSLVRSVLLIEGDPNETVRAAVQRVLEDPRLRMRAHCVRYELTSDPRGRVNQLLARYRTTHGGALPAWQPRQPATVHALASISGEARTPASAPDATTPRRPAENVTFLRARTA